MDEERRESVWSGVGTRAVAIGALATSAVVHVALVFEHGDELFLAGAFAAAALAAAVAAFALTRVELALAPVGAAVLLASLLVAYPLFSGASGDHVDALGLGTKTVEAIGLLAAIRARGDNSARLAPVAALVGFLVAFVLLSATGDTHTH